MTVTTPDTTRGDAGSPAPVARQLLVGRDDGYGDLTLERFGLAPGAGPWHAPGGPRDRLLVVLAGRARVAVDPGGPSVELAADEVVHVGRGHAHRVELLGAGPGGRLEWMLLDGPGGPA
ncbi:cupin domain-containing protein [Pseudonocardia spirodelae]|uniref:Cupin domain-containing protein n=1 Tax=Pseudonocardia spirodelae TaxID=3133431 RepID=A0ABU8T4B8_9PSEU